MSDLEDEQSLGAARSGCAFKKRQASMTTTETRDAPTKKVKMVNDIESSAPASSNLATASGVDQNGPLVTIADINNNFKVFHFTALLSSKADKAWQSQKGSTLSLEFSDSSTSSRLKVAVFNSNDTYAEFVRDLVVGTTYTVFHGRVTPSNARYNKTGHAYEMVAERHTRIESTGLRSYIYKAVTLLSDLNQSESCHSLLGKVIKKGTPATIVGKKDQKVYVKTSLFIGDASGGSVKLEMWGEDTQEYITNVLVEGDIVFCSNFKVQDPTFDPECLTLGPAARSGIDFIFSARDTAKLELCCPELREQITELERLDIHATSFQNVAPGEVLLATSKTSRSASSAKACNIGQILEDRLGVMLEIESLKRSANIDESKKGDGAFQERMLANSLKGRIDEKRYKFTAFVVESLTLVPDDEFIYAACINTNAKWPCNCKVSVDKTKSGSFFCAKCKTTMDTSRHLYCVNFLLTDDSGSLIARFFDDHVTKMLRDASAKPAESSSSDEGRASQPIIAQDLLMVQVTNLPRDATADTINSAVGQYLTNELVHREYTFTVTATPDIEMGYCFKVNSVDCIDYSKEVSNMNSAANDMI